MKSTVIVVLMVLICTTVALAVPTLDQVSDSNSGGFTPKSGQNFQQGVTAGATGKLTRIDLYATFKGAGTLTINTGSPWQTDTNLVQKNFYASSNFSWFSIDLSSENIYYQTGDKFVIGIIGSASTNSNLGADSSSPSGNYSGGDLWADGNQYYNGLKDLLFKTYVDTSDTGSPAAVPVPSAAILCTIGTLIVSRFRKQ